MSSPASDTTSLALFKVPFECEPAAVSAAVKAMHGFLAGHAWPEKDLMSFDLALTEACNNAVEHAPKDARSQPLLLEAFAEPGQVEFRVHDHTRGFNWPAKIELPAAESENGRGLYLISCIMDHADYLRGRNGNTLVMRKSRPVPEGSAAPIPDDNEKVVAELVEELSSCYESLSAIFRHSAHETRAGSLKEFAGNLFGDLLQIVSAEWFVVRLLAKDGKGLESFASSIGALPSGAVALSDRTVEAEAAQGRQVVWFDTKKPLSPEDPLAQKWPGAVGIVQPVVLGGELMGTVALGKRPSSKPAQGRAGLVFTAAHTNVIGTFADYLAIQIANARFQEEQVRQRVVAKELEIAGNIQRSLLPATLPQVPGFSIAGSCRSAREVGGDFFDVLRIHDNAVLMVIADVMGHGVPAALFAAILSTVIRAAPEMTQQPAALLTRINQLLLPELAGVEMFITMQLVHVDAKARKITAASAGHCPLAVASDGALRTFTPEGMPLGVMADALYEDEAIDLAENSRVLLYTDGVTDTRDGQDQPFGQQRLLNWLEKSAATIRSAEQLKAELMADLEKYHAGVPLKDDQTFLILAG